jgi:hypothetical protein
MCCCAIGLEYALSCTTCKRSRCAISNGSAVPTTHIFTVVAGIFPQKSNEQKTAIVYTMDYCLLCRRSFASKEALKQHERASPVHKKKVHCQTCESFFGTKEALEQHQQHSPVHNKTFHCQNCNRYFGSDKTLKNHKRFCQAASGGPLEAVDTPLYRGRDEGGSNNTWSSSRSVDPRVLLERFARMFVSDIAPTVTTHSQVARDDVLEPIQETREFFMFPGLHPNVTDAVSPEISSIWFNEDDHDDNFDHERLTNVMGKFVCNNNACRKKGWNSMKVSIEIRGYDGNGYNAIVYNQRCNSCNRLGTFELDEQSYIDRVAYRLKKWAGVKTEAPFFNGISTSPHKQAYCEGCKRGKCQESWV